MNNVRTGFLAALFGVCAGRRIFSELRFQSWGRTVWHLFLLSLIAGVIVGNCQSCRVADRMEAFRIAFTENFGSELLVLKKEGPAVFDSVLPAVLPEKPREMALPGQGKLYYTGNARQVPASLKDAGALIVVWTPRAFYIVQNDQGAYRIVAQDPASGRMEQRTVSLEGVEKLFRESPGLPGKEAAFTKESTSALFAAGGALIRSGLCIWFTAQNFLLTWLYTGIFMIMYRLLNGSTGRLRVLTLGGMWKCGIYAAFPPMVVASFFPALDLFLSYQTVFMLGLLVYWMAVIAAVERSSGENEERKNEQ